MIKKKINLIYGGFWFYTKFLIKYPEPYYKKLLNFSVYVILIIFWKRDFLTVKNKYTITFINPPPGLEAIKKKIED